MFVVRALDYLVSSCGGFNIIVSTLGDSIVFVVVEIYDAVCKCCCVLHCMLFVYSTSDNNVAF